MFSCELCLQNFNLANALKVHRRLHDNFDKYPCSEDNCEKKFISRKLLRKHIDRHFAHLTALEASGEEKKSNGTIIVPAFIPDGHSARTTPCIFRDLTKRKQDSLDLGQAVSIIKKIDFSIFFLSKSALHDCEINKFYSYLWKQSRMS